MYQRIGAAAYRADLGNITALCDILDNPQRGLKFIHVAGTNGKGSVSHIIASILQAQGYKVGLFVSPHYKDYRERIKINGKLITKPFITKFQKRYRGHQFYYRPKKIPQRPVRRLPEKEYNNLARGYQETSVIGSRDRRIFDKKRIEHCHTIDLFYGRWMIMGRNPMVIFDSAHNEGGIKELVTQIKKIKYGHLHFVYGTVADKDITHILSILPRKANYYFCKPDIPRGKEVADLQMEAAAQKLKGDAYPSVRKAYKAALANAKKDDLVLVSGSIFVVAEVL
ncbi:unnamed protein product [Sphagnum balticum]